MAVASAISSAKGMASSRSCTLALPYPSAASWLKPRPDAMRGTKREPKMQIGFNAPSGGPLATPETLTRLAQEAEALGFGYATVSDHVVIPTDIQAKYPYTDNGEFPAASRGERHEQLTQAMF